VTWPGTAPGWPRGCVLCELTLGGFSGEITAAQATRLLDELEPAGAVAAARRAVAVELVADLRRLDEQLRATKRQITAAVRVSETTLTELFGVGPIIAARRRRCGPLPQS
jgi:transposase